MPITINGNGSITGISAGGLPDASITVDDIANGAITPAKLSTGAPTWDTSSRFLVGTSSAGDYGISYLGNTSRSDTTLSFVSSTAGTANIHFGDSLSGNGQYAGYIGYDHGTDRLVFGTATAERMRIDNAGHLLVAKTVVGAAGSGCILQSAGTVWATRSGDSLAVFNRTTNDGSLVEFLQDGTTEGSISVSGTTVSYNGAHLSRWSQIPGIDPHDKTGRPEIFRGTVMSNLDEMCDWIDPESGDCQDNEQLNKTKVSDVEGDKNVAGVFQAWDDDDDTWVNDYYLAMTGDFVIRIAACVTVERGDLLMSAGDGTAKPQDDDIIRSKTIAKVTSTTVSCTHPDGSYCVPCVLMAC